MGETDLGRIANILKRQDERIDKLYDMLTQLARAGAIQKVVIMNIAKQVGLTDDVLEKMKEIEKLKVD